jgi:hypothetical protein
MVQVISALVTPGGAGISGFPDMVGGIAVSIAAWITASGMMTGVTMRELRVTGGSGGTSASAGGRSTEVGVRNFSEPDGTTGGRDRDQEESERNIAQSPLHAASLPTSRTRTYRKGSNAANHALAARLGVRRNIEAAPRRARNVPVCVRSGAASPCSAC